MGYLHLLPGRITMLRSVLLAVLVAAVSGTAANAAVKTKVVTYTYDGTTLKGFLAWDDSIKGQRPGILPRPPRTPRRRASSPARCA